MYYENYEDYMRGNNNYPNMPNPYYNYTYQNQFTPIQNRQENVGKLYPELYTEINRKIEDQSISNNYRLNEENVNRITDEIFEDYKDKTADPKNQERIKSNNLIKDFIKILVIKYLLSRQRNNNFYQIPPQMPNGYYPY